LYGFYESCLTYDGVALGVAEGLGVALGVAEGLGVALGEGVALGVFSLYVIISFGALLPPIFSYALNSR
jgi:hypothetical protein